ncbi:hypothetical protein [Promicromonospora umidemergens]|nr:hypothetical protein [Promicromonospora umidemergens]
MNEDCARLRPVLAECLSLGIPMPEGLSRHLERCQDCAREAAELGDVVRTLRRAEPAWTRPAPDAMTERPPAELGDRIRRAVVPAQEAARPRRRRRIAAALTAAAVAASVAVAVPLATYQAPPPVSAVALVRDDPMVSHPWGTEIPVSLSGLVPGRTYHLMAVNADGVQAPGGSVRAPDDAPVSARMTTAMPRDTITALVVEDDEGRAVLHVPVEPLRAT